MANRTLLIAGAGLLGIVVISAAYANNKYDTDWKFHQETNDATIQIDQVAISAKLSGYVRSVAVTDNQDVGRGAPLVALDPIDFAIKVKSADAGIATAISARKVALATQVEAQAQIAEAQASLSAAEADMAYAREKLSRFAPLVKSGAESPDMLAQLQDNRAHAAAEVEARRATLTAAQRHVETLGEQAHELETQTTAARIAQAAADNDLQSTRLAAPTAGRIANCSVRVGQFVQPGTRLMTIVPDGEIYVTANFKETQVGLMRPRLPATVRVDALPGVAFPGTVVSITPGTGANFSLIPPQNASGNFTKIVQRVPVKIRIFPGPAARRVLIPGLSVDVEVDTRASRDEIQAIRSELSHEKGA